jgi:hypothetical protein
MWAVSFANCSVALHSNSASVHCIKHNYPHHRYPDHRDKRERQKRGERHKLLPLVGLWTEARSRSPPSLLHHHPSPPNRHLTLSVWFGEESGPAQHHQERGGRRWPKLLDELAHLSTSGATLV